MDREEVGWIALVCVAALFTVTVWLYSSESNQRKNTSEVARIEVCSYSCNLHHGKWPDKVEWAGRDEKGQATCKCLYLSKKESK